MPHRKHLLGGREAATLVSGASEARGLCRRAGKPVSFHSPAGSQPGSAITTVSFCYTQQQRQNKSCWLRTATVWQQRGRVQGKARRRSPFCKAGSHSRLPATRSHLLHPSTPGKSPTAFAAAAWTRTRLHPGWKYPQPMGVFNPGFSSEFQSYFVLQGPTTSIETKGCKAFLGPIF